MIYLRKFSTIALAIMLCSITTNAAEPIAVKLDSVNSNYVEYVDFEKTAPVIIENTTMVPVRSFAQASGMEVEWDQTTLTALASIDVTQNSDSPIVQYGKQLINKVSDYGLELTPKEICASLQADNQNGTIRYIFTDSEGDEVCVGKLVDLGDAPRFVEGHTLVTPIRTTAELFGLDVKWDQNDLEVAVSIPETVVAPMDVKIIPPHQPIEVKEEVVPAASTQDERGTYLGNFKISHYCPCTKCCGQCGGNTAWAGRLVPGQTIAVDPNTIPKLSWVYIDGYGARRAEDRGGAIKGNRIDVAVATHAEALRLGVTYKDVWLK